MAESGGAIVVICAQFPLLVMTLSPISLWSLARTWKVLLTLLQIPYVVLFDSRKKSPLVCNSERKGGGRCGYVKSVTKCNSASRYVATPPCGMPTRETSEPSQPQHTRGSPHALYPVFCFPVFVLPIYSRPGSSTFTKNLPTTNPHGAATTEVPGSPLEGLNTAVTFSPPPPRQAGSDSQ